MKTNLKIYILLTVLSLSLSVDPKYEFCWREYTGTGLYGMGKPIHVCAPGLEQVGLLCYDPCPNGFKRIGVDCHQICPDGLRDDGLFCRKAEYGRGAGYPWTFGDGFNDRGMFERCEKDHGKGNCEKYGLIVYPKCIPGYHPFGCCICRPETPNCKALGLNGRIDLSCAKKIIIGRPQPLTCSEEEVFHLALCYQSCPNNFKKVSNVCEQLPQKGWVSCQNGLAKSEEKCKEIILKQKIKIISDIFFSIFENILSISNPENSLNDAIQQTLSIIINVKYSIKFKAEEIEKIMEILKNFVNRKRAIDEVLKEIKKLMSDKMELDYPECKDIF